MLFSGSIQDYVLLEKLNKLTVTKYSEMSDTAKTLITVMEELDKKCKDLNECTCIVLFQKISIPLSPYSKGFLV